eukprot:357277-Chlamydomonas_euryale.AAC.9
MEAQGWHGSSVVPPRHSHRHLNAAAQKNSAAGRFAAERPPASLLHRRPSGWRQLAIPHSRSPWAIGSACFAIYTTFEQGCAATEPNAL